MKLLKQS